MDTNSARSRHATIVKKPRHGTTLDVRIQPGFPQKGTCGFVAGSRQTEYLHWNQLLAIRRMAGADLHSAALHLPRLVLEDQVSRGVFGRVRGSFSSRRGGFFFLLDPRACV